MDQAIDDLVPSQPAEETLTSDDNAMIEGDVADVTPENASEEPVGYDDDVLGNLSEIDIKDRTRARIEDLAGSNKELHARESELMAKLGNLEGKLEAMESVNTSKTPEEILNGYSVQELRDIRRDPEKYEATEETLNMVTDLIEDKQIQAKFDKMNEARQATSTAQAEQSNFDLFASRLGGDDIADQNSTFYKTTVNKLSAVQNTFNNVETLQQALSVALARIDLNEGNSQNLQRQNQKLSRQQMVERSSRATSPGAIDTAAILQDALKGGGSLDRSRVGQNGSSFKDVVKSLNVVKGLE